MHPINKIGSFMSLRANGWSLDKIAKKINVSKTTLWAWDVKHQNQIDLLKQMQFERMQEQYIPSYEEDLKSLSALLTRIEESLANRGLMFVSTAFLMQMSLQLRDRLSRMRRQTPLPTAAEPPPVPGCLTKDEDYPWIQGDSAIEIPEHANGKPHPNDSTARAHPCSPDKTEQNRTNTEGGPNFRPSPSTTCKHET